MILVVFDMHTYKEKLSPRTVAIVHACGLEPDACMRCMLIRFLNHKYAI